MDILADIQKWLTLSLQADSSSIRLGNEGLVCLYNTRKREYVHGLVQLAASDTSGQHKLLAAIQIKNIMKNDWSGDDFDVDTKRLLRSCLFDLALSCSDDAFEYYMDSLRTIAVLDFPHQFSEPLTRFENDVNRLIEIRDAHSLKRLLCVLAGCMVKYELAVDHNEVLPELAEILKHYAPWFYLALESMIQKMDLNVPDVQDAVGSMIHVIAAIHNIDLPEYFEDNASGLWRLLPPILATQFNRTSEYKEEPCDRLKLQIVKLVKHWVLKFSNEVVPFLNTMFEGTLKCCSQTRNVPGQDALASELISLMTGFVRIGWCPGWDSVINSHLATIFNEVVVNNATLTEIDVDELEAANLNYIRQEIEGVQRGQRRNAVMELIKALVDMYSDSIKLVEKYVERAAESDNVLECSLFLLTCCLIKSQTRAHGATEIRGYDEFVHVMHNRVSPLLLNGNSSTLGFVSAVRITTMFRNYMNPPEIKQLLAFLYSRLDFECESSATYLAYFIERVCMTNYVTKKPYIELDDAETTNIMKQFASRFISQDDLDNEFYMSAVWRIVVVVSMPVQESLQLLNRCVELLGQKKINTANPRYIHILFETIGALLSKIGSDRSLDEVALLEVNIRSFGLCTNLLNSPDMTEFIPYFYQFINCLLSSLPKSEPKISSELQTLYAPLCEMLLRRDLWRASAANTTFLMKIMGSYIERSWLRSVGTQNQYLAMLDGFSYASSQRRISTKNSATYAYLIISYAEQESLVPALPVLTKLLVSLKDRMYTLPLCVLYMKFGISHHNIISESICEILSAISRFMKEPMTPVQREVMLHSISFTLERFPDKVVEICEILARDSVVTEEQEESMLDAVSRFDTENCGVVNTLSVTRLDQSMDRAIRNSFPIGSGGHRLRDLANRPELQHHLAADPSLSSALHALISKQ